MTLGANEIFPTPPENTRALTWWQKLTFVCANKALQTNGEKKVALFHHMLTKKTEHVKGAVLYVDSILPPTQLCVQLNEPRVQPKKPKK